MLTPDKKVHIYNFVEGLNVDKPGELQLKIYEHIRKHGGKEPRRLHGGAGVTATENPQGTG